MDMHGREVKGNPLFSRTKTAKINIVMEKVISLNMDSDKKR